MGRSQSAASPLLVIPRSQPLLHGTLVQRRNRFLADVVLTKTHGSVKAGTQVTAHCPNTGAMEGLTRPGTPVLVDHTPSPTRKLAYTWELAQIEGRWIGTNTATPNRLVSQILESAKIPMLPKVRRWAAERGIGHGRRVDFVLESGTKSRPIWVFLEVKNCHLAYPDGWAYFPDCVSERAGHHLDSLERLLSEPPSTLISLDPFKDGKGVCAPAEVRCAVLFIVQIPGVAGVRPSEVHDPAFAKTARRVGGAGVEFYALGIDQDEAKIAVAPGIPVDLKPYDLDPIRAWHGCAKSLKGIPLGS